jgi:hypothetical protein
MKARNPFKVVRDGDEVGEWIINYEGREVGRIVASLDDARRSRDILGYWVNIHADGADCFLDTDSGATEARLAFRNAKEFAREHLAKLLAEGVAL